MKKFKGQGINKLLIIPPATILLLLLIVSIYSLLSYWTPMALDDWEFMSEWERINDKGSAPTPAAFYRFWEEIRLYDNGRLANVLSPLSVMFSPWKEIFPFLTGVCCATIIVGACRMAFSERPLSLMNTACMWAATLYFLPWRNSLFVADYSLNYIWAATITLVFILYVMRMERRGWSISSFTGALLLATVAGAWHEGFAFATLGGFILLTLIRHKRQSWQWWSVGILYAAVTVAVFYCPGMTLRVSQQMGVLNPATNPFKMFADFFPVFSLFALLLVFGLVPSLRPNIKYAWSNDWFVLGLGIIIIGTLLSLIVTHQPRSSFWPDLFAVIMIFILIHPLWRKISSGPFKYFIATIAIVCALIPSLFALVWQYRFSKESEEILSKINHSSTGTVYHDIIPPSSMPIYTLKIPLHDSWVSSFNYKTLGDFIGKPGPAVLPSNMEGLRTDIHGIPLGGNSGAIKIAGSIVLPGHKYEKPTDVPVKVVLEDGEVISTISLMLPFVSDSGEELTYLVPFFVPANEIIFLDI